MRVRKTGIPGVSASGRTSARRPDSNHGVTDAVARDTDSIRSPQLPVLQKPSTERFKPRSGMSRNSAQFLTQVIAQSDAAHSDARLARRFPEQAMHGYANAISLKRVEPLTGTRLRLDAV